MSLPPTSGPTTVAIPDHAVHDPTAPPRWSGGNAATMTASALGVSSAPKTPCATRPATSTSTLGASAQTSDVRAEAEHAEAEDPPLAEDVAERAADEDERREREQVAVGDPLLAGEAAAEIVLDRGQRDVDDRRVEADDERPHDRREQAQALRAGHRDARPRSAQHRRRRDARLAVDLRDHHRELVRIAPRPCLARLERADDRVARGLRVGGRVAAGRVVAAADVPARPGRSAGAARRRRPRGSPRSRRRPPGAR